METLKERNANNLILDSLFYQGGTITKEDVFDVAVNCEGKDNPLYEKYKVAFNEDHMFILNSNFKLLKVAKTELQREYCFKIMKTKVRINNSFKSMLQDPFYCCSNRNVINNILKITKNAR